MRPLVLACAFLFVSSHAAGQAAPARVTSPLDSLAGLWKAQKLFGPTARGPLIVTQDGSGWWADMAGHRVLVRVDGEQLSFDLPDGQGQFRGRRESSGVINGSWIPPASVATLAGGRLAAPVRLAADGPRRWRGDVIPYDDQFTLYLRAWTLENDSLRVVLRNPDRDFGTQIGASRLVRRGNAVRLIGRRAGQPDLREIASGTYDPERDAFTLSFPSRGGTYDFHRDGDDSGYYPRGRTPDRYVYAPPPALDDGWPTGTLEEVGIDRAAVESFVQYLVDMPMDSSHTPQIHGYLIARHGKLVFEEYFHGEHRDRLHDTRSAAKSLTAVLIGAAIHAGAPLQLSTPVYSLMNGGTFPADLEPRKRAMTLEHLLTMSAGFHCDDTDPKAPGNEDAMSDQSEEPNFWRFTMGVPMATAPGEKAVYCSGMPNLALAMLGRATGESPMLTFNRLVGEPMQIRRYGWGLDPAGNPYGGGSVNLLPRDFMKLGQLLLNGGTWKGRRILDAQYTKRMTSRLYHLRKVFYGYLWWAMDYPYKDRTVAVYYAAGNGGQGVLVIPELDLVVATYGANYSAGRTSIHITQELLPRFILPAVREPGDDPRAPVVPREFRTPYGRSDDGSAVTSR